MLIEPSVTGVMNTGTGFVSLTVGVQTEVPDEQGRQLVKAGVASEVRRKAPPKTPHAPKDMETK